MDRNAPAVADEHVRSAAQLHLLFEKRRIALLLGEKYVGLERGPHVQQLWRPQTQQQQQMNERKKKKEKKKKKKKKKKIKRRRKRRRTTQEQPLPGWTSWQCVCVSN